MKIRIYYEDTDCMGIVYHANYLKFCERARSEWFFMDSGEKYLRANAFALREVHAVFKKSARLGDIIEVKNIPQSMDKYTLTLRQEIYRGCELLFFADIKLVHLKDGELAAISPELAEYLRSKI